MYEISSFLKGICTSQFSHSPMIYQRGSLPPALPPSPPAFSPPPSHTHTLPGDYKKGGHPSSPENWYVLNRATTNRGDGSLLNSESAMKHEVYALLSGYGALWARQEQGNKVNRNSCRCRGLFQKREREIYIYIQKYV